MNNSRPNKSFSAMLRDLSTDFYNQMISRQEYVAKRREILDQVDYFYNQHLPKREPVCPESVTQPVPISDTTHFPIAEDVKSNKFEDDGKF